MKDRIVSGIVITALIVILGLAGGYLLAAVMLLISLIGYYEFVRACGILPEGKKYNVLTMLVGVMTAVYYCGLMVQAHRYAADAEAMMHGGDFFTVLMIAAVFLVTIGLYVLAYPKYQVKQLFCALFGFVYIPVMLSFLYRARLLPWGIFVYALIFVCSSVCDTCALAVGMLFGKHKMAPVLSPKKTIEGAVGGVAGSALTAWILALIIRKAVNGPDLTAASAVIGACGGLLSMIGDLAASAIKRENGIKDYGNLIPGHGGIMDRFDSIIFAAPAVYFLGVMLLKLA